MLDGNTSVLLILGIYLLAVAAAWYFQEGKK